MTSGSAAGDSQGENRHAWLQKHPSPLTSAGEFHWYPEAAGPGDRELRAGLREALHHAEADAAVAARDEGGPAREVECVASG